MTTQTSRRQSGFTLVELLIVVLIIGILATIAIPVFNGQRNKAKNSAAQTAVRNALSAARSYSTSNNDSYANLTLALLVAEESSLTSGGTVSAPGATANPNNIFLDNVTATTARICAASKGDNVYCINSISNSATAGVAGDYFGKGADLTAARTQAGSTAAGATSW